MAVTVRVEGVEPISVGKAEIDCGRRDVSRRDRRGMHDDYRDRSDVAAVRVHFRRIARSGQRANANAIREHW
jgi:hypothetical protein